MINGIVIGRQPQLKVVVRIANYPDLEIGCTIDTGFEGALTLPISAVEKLQLPFVARINTNLGNDDNVVTSVYRATIVWDGAEIEVPVLGMGRRPLIGTLLLNNYNLNIDFCDGGILSVETLLK